MNPKVFEPDDLPLMCSDDIVIEIVKLYQDGTWNQNKNFEYLVLKKALFNALVREQFQKGNPNNEVRII